MTRTEERLVDALDAAARVLREDTLRPLPAPGRLKPRPALAAPLAAAAAMLLVVGLGVTLARYLPGSGRSSATGTTPPRYYVEQDLNGSPPVVRSTATGKVTDTVPVPAVPHAVGQDLVAAARDGTFFVAAYLTGANRQRIYGFRLTRSGRVTGFFRVPGKTLGGGVWGADAIAASPDGSQVAVAYSAADFTCTMHPTNVTAGQTCASSLPGDYIDVVSVATGATRVWRGAAVHRGSSFIIASLSWTGNGRELVYLGQWCPSGAMSSEFCLMTGNETSPPDRPAEVWALDPASGGGRLASGRPLLRETARFPYIAQAAISPDGSVITALVLRGPVVGWYAAAGAVPSELSVVQISRATGKQLRVLYRRDLGATAATNQTPEFLYLSRDVTGQYWMLNGGYCSPSDSNSCQGGFNGWIDDGRLVPLSPTNGRLADEAW